MSKVDDQRGRVVPLPPDSSSPTGTATAAGARPPAAWLVTGLALVAVIVAVLVTSRGGESATALLPTTTTSIPTSSTTPTPAPVIALSRLVPGLSQPLTVVYGHGREIAVARWRHNAAAPLLPDASSGRIENGRPLFNSDTTSLAWVSVDRYETLWIGHPHRATPLFIDSAGAAWHPEDPRQLAWVGRPPGSDLSYLYRLRLPSEEPEAPTNSLDAVEVVAEVPTGMRLLGWGDWGFVLSGSPNLPALTGDLPRFGVTQVLGPDGTPLRSAAGLVRAVSSHGDMVISLLSDAPHDPTVTSLGISGSVTVIQPAGTERHLVVNRDLTRLHGFDDDPMTFVFSPDGSTVYAVSLRSEETDIASIDVASGETRTGVVDRLARVAGFVGDGRYLVLYTWQGPESGLVFFDAPRGTAHPVRFSNGEVVGIADSAAP